MPPRLLDCNAVHQEYGVPPDKLRRLMRLNLVPHVRLGRRVFLDREQFERFLREGGRGLQNGVSHGGR